MKYVAPNQQVISGTYDSDDANLVSVFSNDSSVVNNFLDTCNNKRKKYKIFLYTNFIHLQVSLNFKSRKSLHVQTAFGFDMSISVVCKRFQRMHH